MTYNVDVVSIGWNLRRSDTGELDITDASIERRNGNRRGVSIVSCGLVGTEIENDLYRGKTSSHVCPAERGPTTCVPFL